MSPDEFDARVRFVAELARRLHQYGTSAPRLERAIDGVSARLGLLPTSLSTPTSITLSFVDPDDGELALPRRTMVMRVNPGDVNLRRLCKSMPLPSACSRSRSASPRDWRNCARCAPACR
ncbi:MAG: threonine/serine exporter family protein [Xanthomonadales bacterium]|nr:threonine/serine exporter family protein [Xanthomonadales bacterium]